MSTSLRSPSFENDDELIIRTPSADECAVALRILCDGFTPRIKGPHGLIVAARHDEVVAAAWLQPLTDEVAAIWPPKSVFDDLPALSQLTAALANHIRNTSFRIIRSLIPVDSPAHQAESLRKIGLAEHTIITSLYATIDHSKVESRSETENEKRENKPRSNRRLIFHPLAEKETSGTNHSFSLLMQSTYRDSLDCPEIVAALPSQALLDGYTLHSDAASRLWFQIATADKPNEPIAALIMSNNQEDEQIDLLYLGVVPESRGKKIGAEILEFAKSLALDLGHRRIVISVDVRNTPAVRLYQQSGFVPYAEHRLFAMAGPKSAAKDIVSP